MYYGRQDVTFIKHAVGEPDISNVDDQDVLCWTILAQKLVIIIMVQQDDSDEDSDFTDCISTYGDG